MVKADDLVVVEQAMEGSTVGNLVVVA